MKNRSFTGGNPPFPTFSRESLAPCLQALLQDAHQACEALANLLQDCDPLRLKPTLECFLDRFKGAFRCSLFAIAQADFTRSTRLARQHGLYQTLGYNLRSESAVSMPEPPRPRSSTSQHSYSKLMAKIKVQQVQKTQPVQKLRKQAKKPSRLSLGLGVKVYASLAKLLK
jgi:hypothetical protein